MRYIAVFIAIVGCYLSPLYFVGDDLTISMLVESGVRSGFLVSLCVWAAKDFKLLIHIATVEILLIFISLIIVIDFHSHITDISSFIFEINRAVFYFELFILAVAGIWNAGAIYRDINSRADYFVLHPPKNKG